jgi:hypothetical protein
MKASNRPTRTNAKLCMVSLYLCLATCFATTLKDQTFVLGHAATRMSLFACECPILNNLSLRHRPAVPVGSRLALWPQIRPWIVR